MTALNTLLLLSLCIASTQALSAEFSQKLDLQTRVDDRSSSNLRYQYRARYYPSLSFDNNWSVNGFVVTGDDFSSSHNTFDDGSADYFYIRRVFVRHEDANGKTEIGIIPTFKGAVSSSGLSKDGWIKGIRHVVRNKNKGAFEIVVGQLDNLSPNNAIRLADDLNYIELEYSSAISRQWSYELSLERMTESNFARTELRYAYSQSQTLFAELVSKLGSSKIKSVLGVEGEFRFADIPFEYFAHYSHVSDDFGARAELTEDFLGTGNGISAELESMFADSSFGWFVRFDAVESQSRFLAGVKWSFK
jgi:hypothetical protein